MSAYDEHGNVLGRAETSEAQVSMASTGALVLTRTREIAAKDAQISVTLGLNLIALAGIAGALAFAFAVQFGRGELPCPLCLLQRLAFVMVGVGLLLNLTAGERPLHYAVAIASAMGGIIPSLRQILLHLHPGDPGFGSTLFGLHFYTWAFVGFTGLVMFCALCLALMPAPGDTERGAPRPAWQRQMVRGIGGVFLLLTLGNVVSTTLECGLGSCPDDPVHYLWLPRASLSDL